MLFEITNNHHKRLCGTDGRPILKEIDIKKIMLNVIKNENITAEQLETIRDIFLINTSYTKETRGEILRAVTKVMPQVQNKRLDQLAANYSEYSTQKKATVSPLMDLIRIAAFESEEDKGMLLSQYAKEMSERDIRILLNEINNNHHTRLCGTNKQPILGQKDIEHIMLGVIESKNINPEQIENIKDIFSRVLSQTNIVQAASNKLFLINMTNKNQLGGAFLGVQNQLQKQYLKKKPGSR